jgi:hypothetical protein
MCPRGFFGWLGGHLECGRCCLDLRRSVGAKLAEDSRNLTLDPSDQFGKCLCLRCEEKFVELALGTADVVEKLTQLSFDQVGFVRRRLRDHDRLRLPDRRQRSVSAFRFRRQRGRRGALARRKRLTESLVESSGAPDGALACAMVSAGMGNPCSAVYQSCGLMWLVC